MTFTVGHVEGGTRAGWRKVRQAPPPWECDCLIVHSAHYSDGRDSEVVKETPRHHPRYMLSCPDCKAERDAVAS